jgi:transposase
MTLLLAVSRHGVVAFDIMDRNCKKADFVSFVERLPVEAGTALVMDNIQFHRSRETLQAIQDKGCVPLFTPPYSPRFNPVEMVFSAVKRTYRRFCPPVNDDAFDYASLLHNVVDQCDGLAPYFDHVRKLARDVVVDASSFCGYDVR